MNCPKHDVELDHSELFVGLCPVDGCNRNGITAFAHAMTRIRGDQS